MIVADASVIVALVVQEHVDGKEAESLYERLPDWVAPPLWRSEVLNALGRYVRHRGVSMEAAELAFARAEEVVMEAPFRPDATILHLMTDSGCSGYDAHYVALAASIGAPLATNDRRLVAAFPGLARSPEDLRTG